MLDALARALHLDEDATAHLLAVRRELLEHHRDEVLALIDVEFAFSDIYSRGGLSLRERELATVAILTVLAGREPQLDVHLRAARNVGLSVEELRETIIHTVPYAGFPTAINAMHRLDAPGSRRASRMSGYRFDSRWLVEAAAPPHARSAGAAASLPVKPLRRLISSSRSGAAAK